MKSSLPGQDVPAVDPATGRWSIVWFEKFVKFVEGLNPLSDIDFPHDDTKSDYIRTPNVKSANYTLGLDDAKKVQEVWTGGGVVTVSLPARGAVLWEVGTQIDFVTWGGNNLPISFPANVVVISKNSYMKIAADEAGMLLYFGDDGTNQYWFLRGTLVP